MNLSIILPILNEEDLVERSVLGIYGYCRKFSNFEIVAVDDGSTDKTHKILSRLKKKYKKLKIVVHRKNKGYGAALRSGVKNSSYDWIFFTDADMQFSIKDMDRFLPFVKDFDFIVGYRKQRADTRRRIITSWGYNKAVKLLFGLPLKDVDCAFKLMKKSAILKTAFFSDSFFVSAELMTKAYRKRFKIKEIGVTHLPRSKGSSTVTLGKILRAVLDLVKLRLSYI